jgi:hypothetical protein
MRPAQIVPSMLVAFALMPSQAISAQGSYDCVTESGIHKTIQIIVNVQLGQVNGNPAAVLNSQYVKWASPNPGYATTIIHEYSPTTGQYRERESGTSGGVMYLCKAS